MPIPSYAWPARSGIIGALLTILAVSAYDFTHVDLNGGAMIGLIVGLTYTAVEVLRTRATTSWTILSFLSAAGMFVLLGMATTGAFQLYRLATG